MPKQKTITVYQYSELSEKAKERARDWYLNALGADDSYFAWDSVKEDAKNVFLVLKGVCRERMSGEFKNDARHTLNAILDNHGQECETYKTAARYKNELDALAWTEAAGDAWDEEAYNEKAEEFLRDILEDYRVMYEKELEYQMSEEFISESMEANEYEFDEKGRRI